MYILYMCIYTVSLFSITVILDSIAEDDSNWSQNVYYVNELFLNEFLQYKQPADDSYVMYFIIYYVILFYDIIKALIIY